MTEFGHFASRGKGIFIDEWGAGPFVILDERGKSCRFEDSNRFGPMLVKTNGDIRDEPWPGERSAFWRAHRIWKRQGRRVGEDGQSCIWDEPKPQTIRHMGGRNWVVVENGEEDGKTIKLPFEADALKDWFAKKGSASPLGGKKG